jgi:hypothetical protein
MKRNMLVSSLVLLLFVLHSVGIAAIRKGPYLIYPKNNDQMTVLWQLDLTAVCTLAWGLDTTYSIGSTSVSEYGTDHQYKYTITGLAPGAKYYYRITQDTNTYTGSFRAAAAADATSVKFLVYGDTRTNMANHNSVCSRIVSTFTADANYQSILLHVGDWVEVNAENNWRDEYFNRSYAAALQTQASLPIQGCMGNHEGTGTVYTKYWPYPYFAARYWSFDYGPAHIAVVDQYTSYAPGSAQLTWLTTDLSGSTKHWKFIVLHEPGWSAYGSGGTGHSNNTFVQTYIQPLCEQYGVQIVFCGHNHYYARADVNGVQHITTGGGGAPLADPLSGQPNVVFILKTFQFCRININGSRLDYETVKPDGTVFDSFQLTLCDSGISPVDYTGPEGIPDCKVDFYDLAVLAADWLDCADGPCTDYVDFNDFASFAIHWLDCTDASCN